MEKIQTKNENKGKTTGSQSLWQRFVAQFRKPWIWIGIAAVVVALVVGLSVGLAGRHHNKTKDVLTKEQKEFFDSLKRTDTDDGKLTDSFVFPEGILAENQSFESIWYVGKDYVVAQVKTTVVTSDIQIDTYSVEVFDRQNNFARVLGGAALQGNNYGFEGCVGDNMVLSRSDVFGTRTEETYAMLSLATKEYVEGFEFGEWDGIESVGGRKLLTKPGSENTKCVCVLDLGVIYENIVWIYYDSDISEQFLELFERDHVYNFLVKNDEIVFVEDYDVVIKETEKTNSMFEIADKYYTFDILCFLFDLGNDKVFVQYVFDFNMENERWSGFEYDISSGEKRTTVVSDKNVIDVEIYDGYEAYQYYNDEGLFVSYFKSGKEIFTHDGNWGFASYAVGNYLIFGDGVGANILDKNLNVLSDKTRGVWTENNYIVVALTAIDYEIIDSSGNNIFSKSFEYITPLQSGRAFAKSVELIDGSYQTKWWLLDVESKTCSEIKDVDLEYENITLSGAGLVVLNNNDKLSIQFLNGELNRIDGIDVFRMGSKLIIKTQIAGGEEIACFSTSESYWNFKTDDSYVESTTDTITAGWNGDNGMFVSPVSAKNLTAYVRDDVHGDELLLNTAGEYQDKNMYWDVDKIYLSFSSWYAYGDGFDTKSVTIKYDFKPTSHYIYYYEIKKKNSNKKDSAFRSEGADFVSGEFYSLTNLNGITQRNKTYKISDVWIDLYLREKTYTIKFDGNGATSGSMSDMSLKYSESKNLTKNTYSRLGYTFLGWSTSETSGYALYKDEASVSKLTKTNNGTITLYAVWKANSYSIKFDGNGGSGSMADLSMTYDKTKNLTPNGFSKTGYTFAGWSTYKYATSATYTNGQSVKNLTAANGGVVTLYAVWSANTYTIKFDGNGETSGSMSNLSMTYGVDKNLTANRFSRTGYTFLGWSTSATATSVKYTDEASVVNLTAANGGVVTLYAVWAPNIYNGDNLVGHCYGGSLTIDNPGNNSFTVYGVDNAWIIDATNGKSNFDRVLQVQYYDGDWYDANLVGESTSGTIATRKIYKIDGEKIGDLTISISESSDNSSNGVNFSVSSDNSSFDLPLKILFKNVHKLECVPNGGTFNNSTDSTSLLVVEGEKYSEVLKTKPTREGYEFAGWWTAESGGTQVLVSTIMGAQDATIYAHWTAGTDTKYKVEHYLENTTKNGYVLQDTDNLTGTTNTNTAAVAKKYEGFTAGSVVQEKINGNGTTVIKICYTRNVYSISFVGNGETSGSMNNLSMTYDVAKNLTANRFSRTGYTFLGWSTNANATSVTYEDQKSVSNLTSENNKTIILYAVWQANKYTIKFDGNGATSGSMSNLSMTYDVAKNLTANAFLRAGYTFVGWSTNANASTASYTNGQSVNNLTAENDGIVTLYAVWNPNDGTKYVVKHYLQNIDGTYGEAHSTENYTGTTDTLVSPDVKKFVGFESPNVITINISGDGSTVCEYYYERKSYVLTFNYNGNGQNNTTITLKYEQKYGTLPTPTRVGYEFAGWWTAKSGGTQVSATTKMGAGNTTIYAHWTANKYTIKFDGNGKTSGSMSNLSMTYDVAKNLTANGFLRTGYTFVGWSADKNAASETYKNQESVENLTAENDGVVTLYAVWAANKYKINFFGNGATSGSMADLSMTFDVAKNLTANGFLRTGYTFVGWSTDANATSVAHVDQASVENLTDENDGVVTLYAVWQVETYRINFVGAGETLVGVSYIDVKFGEAFGVLPTAVTSKFGKHFSHWVLNNEQISKDTVARDFGENGTELEAVPVFVANEISVVFYPNLPSELGMSYDSVTRSYVFGAGSVCPNVDMFSFANMNLVFKGWALTDGGDVAIKAGEGLWNEWFENHEAVRNLYAVFSFEVEFNFGAPEFGPKIDAQVEQWLSNNKTDCGLPNVEDHRLYKGLGWFVDETKLSDSNFFAEIINGANASSAARVEVLFAWQVNEFSITYKNVCDTGDTVVGAVNSNVVKYTCESGSVALSALADVDKFHFMGFVIGGKGRYVADGFVSEVPLGADTLGDIVVYCNWLRLYSIEVRYRDLAMGAETVMFVGLDGSISSEKLSIWRDGFRMPVLALGSFVTKIKGDDGSIYIGVAYGNVKFRCKGIEKDGTRIAGDGTGNVDFVNSSISVKPNGDVVIEFVYVQRVVLSFNPDGGSAVDAVEMDVDTSIADEMARRGVNAWTQDKVSARDGFVFGWWETADGTRVESVRGLEIGENTILKAHWLAEVGFEVVDQNGNKLDVDADVLPGQIVELGTKVKDLDIWRRWAVSGNVDNDKYFAHYKVGVNFYLIGSKLYRVDPGCIDETIIAQNCVVQIRVIERVELTFVTDASDTKNGFVLHMASSFEEYNKDAWAEKLIYLQSGNAVGDSYQFVLNMDIAQEVEFFVIKYTRRGQNADGELVEFRLVSWADANGNVVLSGGSNARVFEAFASATLYANWVEAKGVSVGEFDGTGVHFADELIGYPQGDQILEFVLNGNVLEAVLVDGDNRTVVATMVCDNIVVDGETYRVVGFILSRSEVFDLFAEAVTTPNVVASTTIFPAAADGGNLFLYLAYEKV